MRTASETGGAAQKVTEVPAGVNAAGAGGCVVEPRLPSAGPTLRGEVTPGRCGQGTRQDREATPAVSRSFAHRTDRRSAAVHGPPHGADIAMKGQDGVEVRR